MSTYLKVNLERYFEEFNAVGTLIFQNPQTIEVLSGLELKDSEATEFYEEFIIQNNDADDCLDEVALKLVHKQYDFESETLFGFYEIITAIEDDTRERLEEVASIFNKKDAMALEIAKETLRMLYEYTEEHYETLLKTFNEIQAEGKGGVHFPLFIIALFNSMIDDENDSDES